MEEKSSEINKEIEEPTEKDWKRFHAILQKLEGFEATQRFLRGYGALDDSDLGTPEYQKVSNFIEKKAGFGKYN